MIAPIYQQVLSSRFYLLYIILSRVLHTLHYHLNKAAFWHNTNRLEPPAFALSRFLPAACQPKRDRNYFIGESYILRTETCHIVVKNSCF